MKKILMFIFNLDKEEELKDIYGLIVLTLGVVGVLALAPYLLFKVPM